MRWLILLLLALPVPALAQDHLQNLRLELRFGNEPVTGPLTKLDDHRWSFTTDTLQAVLTLKDGTAHLDYQGPPPDPVDGLRVILELPEFTRGLSIARFKPYWTAPVFTSDYRTLSGSSLMLLWQAGDDNYHLLMPFSGGGMVGELGTRDYKFGVNFSSRCEGFTPTRIPLFGYASGPDPYELPTRALRQAKIPTREEKPYPEPFRYLGWCSWNTYYHAVDAEKILTSVASLQDKNVPIGFVLVDDGWMTLKDRRLAGFDADPEKFPGGLKGLAEKLDHIRYLGVWHTLQGYWDGVEPSLPSIPARDGLHLPGPGFFKAWHDHLTAQGIDFVKVDNQARNFRFTENVYPLFTASQKLTHDLEEQWTDNLLNCMSMSPENAFSWQRSNLVRNSDDYLPEDPLNPAEHVFQNLYSAYWTAAFAYPDYDMFETHNPRAEFHAVARAISGGPIYTTDSPGRENAELLRAFCLEDGRLLQLDAPGQVTPDCLLRDASLEPIPLKAFGRIKDTTMVAAFHVNKSAGPLSGRLDVPGDVVTYQRSTGRVHRTLPEFSLEPMEADLFTVVPVNRGTAVLGLLDKFLGPAAVESQLDGDTLTVTTRGAGRLGVWLAHRPRSVTPEVPWSYRETDGLFELQAPAARTFQLGLR